MYTLNKRQTMNWPLAANFEATNVTFLPKKLALNVQSTCIDNSKRPKSKLWHYCIKATICFISFQSNYFSPHLAFSFDLVIIFYFLNWYKQEPALQPSLRGYSSSSTDVFCRVVESELGVGVCGVACFQLESVFKTAGVGVGNRSQFFKTDGWSRFFKTAGVEVRSWNICCNYRHQCLLNNLKITIWIA